MNWETFFDIGENVTADEARQFISSGESDRYQLVDVRQPKEYDQSHIPGSILIPLSDLPKRQDELDKNKPLIVYCRSGVRSKAACQILSLAGASYVFNMSGGILGWDGEEATGAETAGLEYFVSDDSASTFAIAYQMEAGLRQFYQVLANREDNEKEKEMLTQMALFEDGHMARLKSKHKEFISELPDEAQTDIMEGGINTEEMINIFGSELESPEKILQLAMKFEAQAFDLYCRLAKKHHGTEVSRFYREMANEEQQHLLRLSRKLDSIL